MESLVAKMDADRDENGTIHINRSAPGCRYCGVTEVKYSANGKVAMHHPGAECCEQSIKRMLTIRKEEKAKLYAEYKRLEDEANDLAKDASHMVGKEAMDAKARVAKMRNGLRNRTHDGSDHRPQGEWHLRIYGNDKLDVLGLEHEIADLESKLRASRAA